MNKKIGAPGHLMFTNVGDDQLLAVEFMRALDTSRGNGVAFSGVTADDHYQIGRLDIGNRSRIATVTDGPEQSGGGRRLAITRTVVDVVGANDGAGQLLHEIALFICAL